MAFLASLGLLAGCSAADGSALSPKEFLTQSSEDETAVVLDVRTPGEYASGHIEGAVLLDFRDGQAFDEGIDALDKSKTYYIYCHSGNRSGRAAAEMKARGLKVVELQGGMIAWALSGLPTVTD